MGRTKSETNERVDYVEEVDCGSEVSSKLYKNVYNNVTFNQDKCSFLRV